MLHIGVITLFPGMFSAVVDYGITGKAIKSGFLALSAYNPRDYTTDNHRTVDDRPYGGGPGMVMMAPPLRAAIGAAKTELPGAAVIYLSPQGKLVKHRDIATFAGRRSLIFVAGRYEGIDERVIELDVDEEWSIGDYVLSGGELPAMVLIDAVARCLPGVLGNAESASADSFYGGLLDHPHYTRPERVHGKRVPEVLLSGDHAAIRKWRLKQALGRTRERRPDLLKAVLDTGQQVLLDEYISEQRRVNDKA